MLAFLVASSAHSQSAKPNVVVIWGDDIGQTIADYPPLQEAASFHLDEVVRKLSEGGGAR